MHTGNLYEESGLKPEVVGKQTPLSMVLSEHCHLPADKSKAFDVRSLQVARGQAARWLKKIEEQDCRAAEQKEANFTANTSIFTVAAKPFVGCVPVQGVSDLPCTSLAEGGKYKPRHSSSILWELISSLTAPLASQLIFIKLSAPAVLWEGRNIKQKVQRGWSRRSDLTPG